MRIGAIIMASGFSARMGQNKLLMEYRGKSLAEHVMDTVNDCGFAKVVVVTCYEAVAEMANKRRMTVVINEHPELGQSQSVILGTKALIGRNYRNENDYLAACGNADGDSAHVTVDNNSKIDGLMYFAADMPFLKKATVATLLNAFEGCPHAIIRPRFGKKPGNPVIFPANLAGELCCIRGDNGGREVIGRHPEQVVNVDISDEKQGIDIDDPQEAGGWLAGNGCKTY